VSIEPTRPGEPRRPLGPRDPGDAWVVADSGEKYWGRFGAAGLLAVDPNRGVLLQHRVAWSHFGDTWGLPGGARHEGEGARDAALREAAEEAGVPAGVIVPRFVSVLDLDVWTYTTLVGDVVRPFDPVISDPESRALAWVPVDEVDDLPLHPGFADAWPVLRTALPRRPVLVVDVANVVGSVPDGWWRDRAGAAARLVERLAGLAATGVPAGALGLIGAHWFPPIIAVIEGAAREAHDLPDTGVRVVRAGGSGDDEIVAQTASLPHPEQAVVVTSDRGLRQRASVLGATVHGAGWLLDLLR
jgi:8-oxo-dGTP pyrophosphatase MutT (NUDIX family)